MSATLHNCVSKVRHPTLKMVINLAGQQPSPSSLGDHVSGSKGGGKQAEDVGAMAPVQQCVAMEKYRMNVHLITHAEQMPGYRLVLAQHDSRQVSKHVSINSYPRERTDAQHGINYTATNRKSKDSRDCPFGMKPNSSYFLPCIRFDSIKSGSSGSTPAASEQLRMLSFRYQLRFSSTTLNIRKTSWSTSFRTDCLCPKPWAESAPSVKIPGKTTIGNASV